MPDTARANMTGVKLRNPELFREQCYIDGAWVDADDGATLAGRQPGRRQRSSARCPKMGARRDAPRDRGGERGLPGLAREDRQGARGDPAQVVRPDDGEPGGPRPC